MKPLPFPVKHKHFLEQKSIFTYNKIEVCQLVLMPCDNIVPPKMTYCHVRHRTGDADLQYMQSRNVTDLHRIVKPNLNKAVIKRSVYKYTVISYT